MKFIAAAAPRAHPRRLYHGAVARAARGRRVRPRRTDVHPHRGRKPRFGDGRRRRHPINAVAGALIVHPGLGRHRRHRTQNKDAAAEVPASEASMFYTAYFKEGAPAETRPITFLFNGGPGSPTLCPIWEPMVPSASKPRSCPRQRAYRIVPNEHSLLDVSDLVFIDAPGTGFSRVAGKDKETAWFGVDQDIHAFTVFVRDFLSKYGRWKSPKYLYGESAMGRCAPRR